MDGAYLDLLDYNYIRSVSIPHTIVLDLDTLFRHAKLREAQSGFG
jgi:hypothetical protein